MIADQSFYILKNTADFKRHYTKQETDKCRLRNV